MHTAIRSLLVLSIIGGWSGIASAQAMQPDPLPPLTGGSEIYGRFDIRYIPKMCVRAPCPPGHYEITESKEPVGRFRTIILLREVGGDQRTDRYEGRYLDGIGGVEGRFFREGETARIVVVRTVEGGWTR